MGAQLQLNEGTLKILNEVYIKHFKIVVGAFRIQMYAVLQLDIRVYRAYEFLNV